MYVVTFLNEQNCVQILSFISVFKGDMPSGLTARRANPPKLKSPIKEATPVETNKEQVVKEVSPSVGNTSKFIIGSGTRRKWL